MGEPIRMISSMATAHLLAALRPRIERETGFGVELVATGGVDAAKRIEGGEAFDVVVLAADALDRLTAGGHVDAQDRAEIARCGIAAAVKAGAARPDIGSEDALREAVSAAPTIGWSTGPSGAHLARLVERWGLAEALRGKIVVAPPGVPVGTLIAKGEVGLGFQQASELIHVEGIALLGPLPAQVQAVTAFCGGRVARSPRVREVRELLAWLASPRCDDARLAEGMEIPSPAGGG